MKTLKLLLVGATIMMFGCNGCGDDPKKPTGQVNQPTQDTLIIAPTKGTVEIEDELKPPPVTESFGKKQKYSPVQQAKKPRGPKGPKGQPPIDTGTTTPPPVDPLPPVGQCLILYDFDGIQIESNSGWNGNQSFYCTPSKMVTDDQKQSLYLTQNAYSPYNGYFTDQQAEYDAWTGPKHIVVVTPYSSWYPNASFTGVSYVGSLFGGSKYSFVFEDRLFSNSFYVGCIMVHETGHAIGLSHQADCTNGTMTNTYSNGKWMGYCFNVSNWVVGTRSYDCQTQDDDKILSTNLGYK